MIYVILIRFCFISVSSSYNKAVFFRLAGNDRGYGHPAVCGSIRCRGTTKWMRAQNPLSARRPAGEHRRVLGAVHFIQYVVLLIVSVCCFCRALTCFFCLGLCLIKQGAYFINWGRYFKLRGACFTNQGYNFINRGGYSISWGAYFINAGDCFINRGGYFINMGSYSINRGGCSTIWGDSFIF